MNIHKSVKPADAGTSNRLLKLAHHAENPRKLSANTLRHLTQLLDAKKSFVSDGNVSNPALVIGIDPGAHGAIAVLNQAGDLLQVVDMPATTEANGRTATNAPLLASILARTHGREAAR